MTDLMTSTTAILVIDMQNDNLHPDGAFADSGAAQHAQEQDVIAHVRTILDAGRSAGTPVFHNRIVAFPAPAGLGGSNAPIFRMIGPDSLMAGSWGADIIDGLDPQAGEPILDRIRMSAFHGTALDVMLRNLAVTDVVIVGVWTNMAVEHTARDAADFGYRVTVASDATSSINADWHRVALDYALTNIATIATTAEIAAELTGSATATRSPGSTTRPAA
jgi:ureidoacrylate peracid hydrolase